ncbi:MAG: ABC transporter permease subunit [Myxococcales bacterium]|nr:ABC transporter permease subunit [Myxococcales bacterium]
MLRYLLLLLFLGSFPSHAKAEDTVRIGSKSFTESMVLAEIAKKLVEQQGYKALHKPGMGGTIILWQALKTGSIDIYPEYTGTLQQQILKSSTPLTLPEMRKRLDKLNIGMTEELGFNNTYAFAMRRKQADALKIRTLSDLRKHPSLRVGLTHEFLKRKDGWAPLAQHYNLRMKDIKGIDHAIGYSALLTGSIDVKDIYSTDAKLLNETLVVLADDQQFFPSYRGVFLYQKRLSSKLIRALQRTAGTLPQQKMIQLNAEAEQSKSYTLGAALYFGKKAWKQQRTQLRSYWSKLWTWLQRHLYLVFVSLFFATLVGVPLGIAASKRGLVGQLILGATGVLQTIPALALLALLVPFLGITAQTAIVALFLYSLLPIVRNTATGLQEIPPHLRESAESLGLPPHAQLLQIFLPLASPTILAGIKTSAVINVGTATLAALIGAGGLGEPIISGLNLNDHGIILEGAIPAALLAVLVQVSFELLGKIIIPKGLRLHK